MHSVGLVHWSVWLGCILMYNCVNIIHTHMFIYDAKNFGWTRENIFLKKLELLALLVRRRHSSLMPSSGVVRGITGSAELSCSCPFFGFFEFSYSQQANIW